MGALERPAAAIRVADGDALARALLGLLRDPPLADRFFDEGPRAVRALRLRHGGAPGGVTRQQIEAWLAADVAATLLRPDAAPD